jgi:hypothetical protein
VPARSTFFRFAIVIPLTSVAAVIACSNSPAKPIDAFQKKDAPPCALPASYATPSFSAGQRAGTVTPPTGYTQEMVWQGVLGGSGSGEQDIAVLAFSGGGATGSGATPDWPTGNVTAKSSLNLNTDPDVIVEIATNFAMNGSGSAQTYFLATVGTLNITTASPSSTTAPTAFAGNASGLTFVHYDITSSSVTPDPDNCTSTMPSFTFSASINPVGIKADDWTAVFRARQAAQ